MHFQWLFLSIDRFESLVSLLISLDDDDDVDDDVLLIDNYK